MLQFLETTWRKYTLVLTRTAWIFSLSFLMAGTGALILGLVRGRVNLKTAFDGLFTADFEVGAKFVIATIALAALVCQFLVAPILLWFFELFGKRKISPSLYRLRSLRSVLWPTYGALFVVSVTLFWLANLALVGNQVYDFVWSKIIALLGSPFAVVLGIIGYVTQLTIEHAVLKRHGEKEDEASLPLSSSPWTFGELNLDVGAFGTEPLGAARRVRSYLRARRRRVTSSGAMQQYFLTGETLEFSPLLRIGWGVAKGRRWLETRRGGRARAWGGLTRLKARLSTLLMTHEQQFFVTSSTTNALLLFLNAARPQFDAIVSSDLEHPVVLHLLNKVIAPSRCPVHFLKLRGTVEKGGAVQDVVGNMCNSMKNQRILWLLSHVDYATGSVLPIRQLSGIIKSNGSQHVFLVDGAHGPGNTVVALGDSGADGYAFCGHKWLMGTPGSGFLWVTGNLLEQVRKVEYEGPSVLELTGGTVGARATLPLEPFLTCDAHLAYVEKIGWERVLDRQHRMRDLLAKALEELSVFSIHVGPSSSIVAFRMKTPFEGNTGKIVAELRQRYVVGSYVRDRDWARLCIPHFIGRSDTLNVAKIIGDIVQEMRLQLAASSSTRIIPTK